MTRKYDEEKSVDVYPISSSVGQESENEFVTSRPKFFTQLNHFLSRLGGEERGIERVLPHEKTDQVPSYRQF